MKIKFCSMHGPPCIQGCALLLMWFDDSPDDIDAHPIMKKVLNIAEFCESLELCLFLISTLSRSFII